MNCIPLKNVKVFEFNAHDIQNSEEVYFVSPAQTLQYYCSSAERKKKIPLCLSQTRGEGCKQRES